MRRRNRKTWKKSPVARNKAEKCATKYCRNRRAKNPGKKHMLQHCWKCRSRMLKEKHPVTYVLNMLRHSAKKRNLPFTLTHEQFAEFCRVTRYLELRGREDAQLTIDRKDWNEGYHIWNLQTVAHSINSAQGMDRTPRSERGCATTETDPY